MTCLVELDVGRAGGGERERVRLLRRERQLALRAHQVAQLRQQRGQPPVSETPNKYASSA